MVLIMTAIMAIVIISLNLVMMLMMMMMITNIVIIMILRPDTKGRVYPKKIGWKMHQNEVLTPQNGH